MNSSQYDEVCGLTMGRKPSTGTAQTGKMQNAVRSVVAGNRIDTRVYGKSWNTLPETAQRDAIEAKRLARAEERKERETAAKQRLSMDAIPTLLRRNSETPEVLKMRGLHTTDLNELQSEIVWSKAWYLTQEGSQPVLSGKPQYPNRKEAGWADQKKLENLGVAYIKLPRDDLTSLNKLVADRGYTSMERQELSEECTDLHELSAEHYCMSETVAFVAAGSCYYDFRDEKSAILRMHLSEHDLLIIPPGILHRTALDQQCSLSLLRFFAGSKELVFKNDSSTQSQAVRASYLASRKRNSVLQDNHIIGHTQ
eukprot:TRINITY_DN15712_c0_g1_i1.p1 TRINITY_DN15712_c0_g1~~TRINITY_DN15712_c0_g1_i1.p1  ORF type:complete len:311 (+),score=66.70 TRINITY_DN15712_c0_g1_i1:32-964(+)